MGVERMAASLTRLQDALADVRLPLEVPDVQVNRTLVATQAAQLEDYVLPRLRRLDAPLLVVVGGSTGAGKSTLVNSLLQRVVTRSGVIRPTTTSSVLVHHPEDTRWFGSTQILPGLARSDEPVGDPRVLQLVPESTLPKGLAILDAPDIDSVVEENRTLSAQLLAAADLWLFVTSAARYADAVPWHYLRSAAARKAVVAVVLDRVPSGAMSDVPQHLGQMMSQRGLGASPLFAIPETSVSADGLLPDTAVSPIRGWFSALASDTVRRNEVVLQTLDGAIESLAENTAAVTAAVEMQLAVLTTLRSDVERSFTEAQQAIVRQASDGTLLRGEVLARWQEFVGDGEVFRVVQKRIGVFRDRLLQLAKGESKKAEELQVAVKSGVHVLLREEAEAATRRALSAWDAQPSGQQLLALDDTLGRVAADFGAAVDEAIQEWQTEVLGLVSAEGKSKKAVARYLALGPHGVGVLLMIVTLSQAGTRMGSETLAGGTAVAAQKVLTAVLGDDEVRRLTTHAKESLDARVEALLATESARFIAVIERCGLDPRQAEQLTAAVAGIVTQRSAEDRFVREVVLAPRVGTEPAEKVEELPTDAAFTDAPVSDVPDPDVADPDVALMLGEPSTDGSGMGAAMPAVPEALDGGSQAVIGDSAHAREFVPGAGEPGVNEVGAGEFGAGEPGAGELGALASFETAALVGPQAAPEHSHFERSDFEPPEIADSGVDQQDFVEQNVDQQNVDQQNVDHHNVDQLSADQRGFDQPAPTEMPAAGRVIEGDTGLLPILVSAQLAALAADASKRSDEDIPGEDGAGEDVAVEDIPGDVADAGAVQGDSPVALPSAPVGSETEAVADSAGTSVDNASTGLNRVVPVAQGDFGPDDGAVLAGGLETGEVEIEPESVDQDADVESPQEVTRPIPVPQDLPTLAAEAVRRPQHDEPGMHLPEVAPEEVAPEEVEPEATESLEAGWSSAVAESAEYSADGTASPAPQSLPAQAQAQAPDQAQTQAPAQTQASDPVSASAEVVLGAVGIGTEVETPDAGDSQVSAQSSVQAAGEFRETTPELLDHSTEGSSGVAEALPGAPVTLPSVPSGLPGAPVAAPSVSGGLPGAPSGLPGAPSGLPSVPSGLPSVPVAAPSVSGGLPGAPSGLPSAPVTLPSVPSGLPSVPEVSAPTDLPQTSTADAALPTPPIGLPSPPPLGLPGAVIQPPSPASVDAAQPGDAWMGDERPVASTVELPLVQAPSVAPPDDLNVTVPSPVLAPPIQIPPPPPVPRWPQRDDDPEFEDFGRE
jgi:hypothetical protein